ncbi:MAG: hypothetical protein J5J06_07635 [Phycisphaerae bacterium]|nr:hypothetical protein [Phycisphaerae bacterium]
MIVRRVVILLIMLAALAAALLTVRAAQTRASVQALRMERDWLALQREAWQLQASVARLRAPENVHDRLDRFEADLLPPEIASVQSHPDRQVPNPSR